MYMLVRFSTYQALSTHLVQLKFSKGFHSSICATLSKWVPSQAFSTGGPGPTGGSTVGSLFHQVRSSRPLGDSLARARLSKLLLLWGINLDGFLQFLSFISALS